MRPDLCHDDVNLTVEPLRVRSVLAVPPPDLAQRKRSGGAMAEIKEGGGGTIGTAVTCASPTTVVTTSPLSSTPADEGRPRRRSILKHPRRQRYHHTTHVGRRGVRFAPFVHVYDDADRDTYPAPNDCPATEERDRQTQPAQLWITRAEYEAARREYTETITAIQSMESADLFLPESQLPAQHILRQYCVRGCEKYLDLASRFRIRHNVTTRVLEFCRSLPQRTGTSSTITETNAPGNRDHAEAIRSYACSLSAECRDLAYWHGTLNALQCWGTVLEQYEALRNEIMGPHKGRTPHTKDHRTLVPPPPHQDTPYRTTSSSNRCFDGNDPSTPRHEYSIIISTSWDKVYPPDTAKQNQQHDDHEIEHSESRDDDCGIEVVLDPSTTNGCRFLWG